MGLVIGQRGRALGALLMLVLALSLAAACGGDDDDDDAGATSTAEGEATSEESEPSDETAVATREPDPEAVADAHAALPEPEDLPGEGWVVVSEDEFDDDLNIGDESIPACQEISEATEEGEAELEAARIGRAQRSLSLSDTADLVPVSIEVEVNIFDNEEQPAERFELFRDVLAGDEFLECLEESTVQELEDEGGEISVERLDPTIDAPSDGEGFAAVVNASIEFAEGTAEPETLEFALHVEGYVWRYQNAGVTVFISGGEEAITPELVEAVVNTVQEQLEAALAD